MFFFYLFKTILIILQQGGCHQLLKLDHLRHGSVLGY